MKLIKALTAIAFAVSLLASPAFAAGKPGKCCTKAKKEGTECTHKCCVEAKKEGKNCEKCGGTNE